MGRENTIKPVNTGVSKSAEGRHFCVSKGTMNQREELLNDVEAWVFTAGATESPNYLHFQQHGFVTGNLPNNLISIPNFSF